MSREYKRRQRWRRWSAAAQWVDPSSELPPPPGLADAGGRRLCNWFWGRYAWLPLLLRSHSWSLPRNPALSPFMAFSYLFTPSGLSLSHTSKHVPLLCYYFFFFSQCFMISFSLFLSLYVNSSFVFCFLTGFVSLYSSFSCYANLMGCSWKTSFCSSFSFAFLNNFLLCFYSEEREKSEKQRKLLCFLTNWKHLFLLRRILRK